MAYSSLPNPLPLSDAGPVLLACQRPVDLIVPPDQETLIARLREAVVSGAYDLERIAGALAQAAHSLTNCDGAAVALRRQAGVICFGRSGEVAPPIGTPLSAQSGISGECLRGSVIIRCDDTQLDSRVDAEVCMQLGIRAIAAVPLRGDGQTIGILETFSGSPGSFTEEHIRLLRRLGELVESANRRAPGNERDLTADNERVKRPEVEDANVSDTVAEIKSEAKGSGHRYQLIAAGAVLLFFFAGWMVSARFQPQAAVPAANANVEAVRPATPASAPPQIAKPSPERPAARNATARPAAKSAQAERAPASSLPAN